MVGGKDVNVTYGTPHNDNRLETTHMEQNTAALHANAYGGTALQQESLVIERI
jgi:hypothetical protein